MITVPHNASATNLRLLNDIENPFARLATAGGMAGPVAVRRVEETSCGGTMLPPPRSKRGRQDRRRDRDAPPRQAGRQQRRPRERRVPRVLAGHPASSAARIDGQAHHVAEDHRGAVLVGQGGQFGVEDLAKVIDRVLLFGWGTLGRGPLPGFSLLAHGFRLSRDVERDAIEPVADRAARPTQSALRAKTRNVAWKASSASW